MRRIRTIGSDDWAAFRDIRLAALADSPSAFGSTLAEAQVRTDVEWESMVRNRTTGDGSAIWLAESDHGRALGVVAADYVDGTDETELVSMWVAPEERGTGLGVRLVEELVAWAAASGSGSVSLWVMRGNVAAQRLYESAGFSVITDHQPLPDDPCRDEIRMHRPT